MKTTEEKIKEIVQQYPKTDDCKFQTLGELHKWQIREITELIQKGKDKEQNRILKELPQNPWSMLKLFLMKS